MSKVLLIIGIVITSLSLVFLTIFSISRSILKKINKEEEMNKTAEEKQKDKTKKRIFKFSKKIIKKMNKQLIEYYIAVYVISLFTIGGGVALTTVSTVNIINENNASNVEPEPSDPVLNSYRVTWLNYDDSVLEIDEAVKEGTNPSYNGETPSKPQDDGHTYTFSGWNPTLTPVTKDVTYKAQFTTSTKTFAITWQNYNGSELEVDQEVPYGTMPEYNGDDPVKPSTIDKTYSFDGWTPAVTNVSGDATYVAKFMENDRTYNITWLDDDNSELRVDQVAYGSVPSYGTNPSKASTDQYSYEFDGWDVTPVAVTGDATYKATYTQTTKCYTVYWVDYDSTELEVDYDVPYGTTPEYNGNDPQRIEEGAYIYEFSGWSPFVTSVTGDVTYTAAYTETIKTYNVTWQNYDGSWLADSVVEHGQPAIYEGTTPYQAGFVFTGWDNDTENIVSDTVFTATFIQATNYHAINIHNPFYESTLIMEVLEGSRLNDDLQALRGMFADPDDYHHKAALFFTDPLHEDALDLNEPILGTIDVYATYCYEYTVSYTVDNVPIHDEDVLKDQTATHNFSSFDSYTWYDENDLSVEFNFSTKITSDVTLVGIEKIDNSTNI